MIKKSYTSEELALTVDNCPKLDEASLREFANAVDRDAMALYTGEISNVNDSFEGREYTVKLQKH